MNGPDTPRPGPGRVCDECGARRRLTPLNRLYYCPAHFADMVGVIANRIERS